MGAVWRYGCWAELSTASMENVYAFDETTLVEQRGYELEELSSLSQLIVPYGGLSDIGLKAGETVLIASAIGAFGSAAVHIALAIGARVVAMGRNEKAFIELKKIAEPGRVETVQISGDMQRDTDALAQFGPLDVYFDISPPTAGKSSHIKAGVSSLKPGGRISLMGGSQGDIELPHGQIIFNGFTIKGTFMNTTQQARDLIKMVESGALKIGARANMTIKGKFGLDEWETAFNTAAAESGPGKSVCFVPNRE